MLDTKTIGNRITEARKKRNLSQASLAEQLFISSQAVGKWERGESMPDIITLNRLAELLQVDLNYFSGNVNLVSSEKFNEDIQEEQAPEAPETPGKKKLGWNMSMSNWVDADFSGLKNLHEKFSSSNMQRCLFIKSDLSGLQLKFNHIVKCDFSNSDLSGSEIKGSHFKNDNFTQCLLKDAVLVTSHLQGCDFTGADLSGASFKYCSCQKNNLKQAVLNHTSFIASDLNGIEISGVIEDCAFENCSMKNVQFINCRLINTFFKNTNLKHATFTNCEADHLTYQFMKTNKADMSGVRIVE
ncbi:MAG: pentapeptide repeat-containing protein [Chloroflexota bacterium]|nr:pentapeptide repeat-containing protein [Lentimicrobium sp.]